MGLIAIVNIHHRFILSHFASSYAQGIPSPQTGGTKEEHVYCSPFMGIDYMFCMLVLISKLVEV